METTIHQPRDPNTLSNYNNWRTTHTATDFHLLFDEQRLKASATLDLKSITKWRDLSLLRHADA
jgi:leukotriene-A4 hydrolase